MRFLDPNALGLCATIGILLWHQCYACMGLVLYLLSFKNSSFFILFLRHKHLPPYPGSSSFREDDVLESDSVAMEAIVGIVGSDVGAAVAGIINKIIREGFCITHLETRTSTEWKGHVCVMSM